MNVSIYYTIAAVLVLILVIWYFWPKAKIKIPEFAKVRPWQPRRIIKMWEHKGWGDTISWFDFDRRSITGHMTPKPKVGDCVLAKMASGRVGVFKVEKIEHNSVPDMFFGDVSDVGYLDELPGIQESLNTSLTKSDTFKFVS